MKWLPLLAVLALFPGPVFAAETLGPDGFPASWRPSDFDLHLGDAIKASASVAVSGGLPVLVPRADPNAKVAAAVSRTVEVRDWATLNGYGPMNFSNGGETASLWQGGDLAAQQALLAKATDMGIASRALREDWRRALLTEALPPHGKGDNPLAWLVARAQALQALGFDEAAWGLWRVVPAEEAAKDSDVAYGWASAELLAGDHAKVCPVARDKAVANGQKDTRWQAMVAVCQLLAPADAKHKDDAASLGLQVATPVLQAQDPRLLAVMQAVQDGKTVGLSGLPQGPLGGAVVAAYPVVVDAKEGILHIPDMALRRLANSTDLPIALRAKAAVNLAASTGWPSDGAGAWTLVRMAEASGTAPVLPVLPDAVVVARGVSSTKARDMESFVKAALREGDVDAAAAGWAHVVLPAKAKGSAVEKHWAVRMALAIMQGNADAGTWQAWLKEVPLKDDRALAQAQRTALLADGFGVTVPAAVWQALNGRMVEAPGVGVDVAWHHLLEIAARQRDVPRVLTLISSAFAGMPADRVDAQVVADSVRALKDIGHVGIARRVMAEALLGPGLPVAPVAGVAKKAAVAVSATVAPVGEGFHFESLSGTGGIEGTLSAPGAVAAPSMPTVAPPRAPVMPPAKGR